MRLLLTVLASVLCLGCAPKGEPTYQGKPVKYWETMAESESRSDRIAAATALGEIGPDGLLGITKLFRDRDPHIQALAGIAVGRMGAKAVPRLRELLQSPDEGTRLGAALALRHVGPEAEAAIPALTDLLKDEKASVRAAAAKTIRVIALQMGNPKAQPPKPSPAP
jgi:hypothetical protein